MHCKDELRLFTWLFTHMVIHYDNNDDLLTVYTLDYWYSEFRFLNGFDLCAPKTGNEICCHLLPYGKEHFYPLQKIQGKEVVKL